MESARIGEQREAGGAAEGTAAAWGFLWRCGLRREEESGGGVERRGDDRWMWGPGDEESRSGRYFGGPHLTITEFEQEWARFCQTARERGTGGHRLLGFG